MSDEEDEGPDGIEVESLPDDSGETVMLGENTEEGDDE